MMKSSPLQPLKPKASKRISKAIERVSDWSSCSRRRYRLGHWVSRPIACVIGLNLSVANAHSDDPINRRLPGLLCDLGYDCHWLVNLIAESTSYPDRLGQSCRLLSLANRQVIKRAI